MNIAVIGNPITNISSGKFLSKFVRLASLVAQEVYVVNDGRLRIKQDNVHVIAATRFNSRLNSKKKSAFSAFLNFVLVEFGLAFGLLKCSKKVDIVIIFPITSILPVSVAKFMRKRLFLFEAQDILWERSKKGLYSLLNFFFLLSIRNVVLNLFNHIIVEGRSVAKQNLLEKYDSKICLGPLYTDTDKYKITRKYGDRKDIIGFIASIDQRKGILQFVDAIKLILVEKRFVNFLIVGNGDLSNEVAERLKKYLIQDKVRIIHFVSEGELPSLLNELKLYVLPSVSEGLPNSILETMACGTPVVATKVGSIPDVIVDSETGFLLNDNSAESIADGVLRALSHSDMSTIIANGRKLIQNTYSFEAAVKRYNKLLRS
jgi:glycosyltransferase involved in cell wall biosynthesis